MSRPRLLLGACAWLLVFLSWSGGEQASSPPPPEIAESPAAVRSASAVEARLMSLDTSTTTTTVAPTTTTTEPPPPPTTTTTSPPPAPVVPREAVEPPPPPTSAGGCSGHAEAIQARWPSSEWRTACRVLACESGGNPTADNPSPASSASGLWQFLDGTWAGYGGYARAMHAPPSVQHDAAFALWSRSGWSPWSCY